MKRLDSLNLLYPPFAKKLKTAVLNAKAAGIPVEVFETFRSLQRQDTLYAKGRTTAGPIRTYKEAGFSWHHYGIAADIVMRLEGRYNWNETHLYHDAALYFEEQGLYWLGRTGFELVHYQLPVDFSISEAKEIFEKQSILKFWSLLNNRYSHV